jgi:hypothetical protein
VRPRRLIGASGRPLNFTVRPHMKRLCAALTAVVVVSACSDSYRDLASPFGTDKTSTAPTLAADSIVISGPRYAGPTSYNGIVKIRASVDAVDVDIRMPFMKPLSIPTSEIAACAMTCFGTSDQHVDLLIPKTGTDLQIPRSKELLNWCWTNRKPMISGADKRGWHFSGAPLPPASRYHEQFASRQAFDEQTKMSCLGY